MPPTAAKLEAAIQQKTAIVGVIGLGYVGLPLAKAFVSAGFRVLGFDVDERKIAQLLAGESYIEHISASWISDAIAREVFVPTADMRRLREADAILSCVPTPLTPDRQPDLSFVTSTTRQVAAALRPGQLVVLESTTYPGTTRGVVQPILDATALILGQDYFLAYSPEREDPGNPKFSAQNIPKIVGGVEPASAALASQLYRQAVVEVVTVANCEIAEACKMLENTYRAVNIALVNELKIVFDRMDIDIWQVIAAAKTKPFGFQPFYPGPGLGGHCIPIDPFYLSWIAREHGAPARLIELAGEINTRMPHYVVERVAHALGEQGKSLRESKVLILGAAYKPDVDDPRESPAFRIMELLAQEGAVPSYNDPHIPRLPPMRSYDVPPLASQELTGELLAQQDCVLIVTNHSKYDWAFIAEHAPLIVDTRNATQGLVAPRARIYRA